MYYVTNHTQSTYSLLSEYATGGEVMAPGDVYSFYITLPEMFNPIFIGLVFAAETRSVCPQVVSPLCDQQLTLVLAVLATNLSFSPILICLWPVMFVF
jgi:hypothetical protein